MDFKETEAFKLFLSQLNELKPQIESLKMSDLSKQEIKSLLHALKGNSGLFGFSELSSLASEIGTCASGQDNVRFEQAKKSLLLSLSNALK